MAKLEEETIFFTDQKMIKQYLSHLETNKYATKTILNRLLAIQRFVACIIDTLIILINKKLTTLRNTKKRKESLENIFVWLDTQITSLSPLARSETKRRNHREVLNERGKWEEVEVLYSFYEVNKTKYQKMMEKDSFNSKEFMDLQGFVLFALTVLRPPLRTQNYELEVLLKLESPIVAKKNGIFFNEEEDQMILEINKFPENSNITINNNDDNNNNNNDNDNNHNNHHNNNNNNNNNNDNDNNHHNHHNNNTNNFDNNFNDINNSFLNNYEKIVDSIRIKRNTCELDQHCYCSDENHSLFYSHPGDSDYESLDEIDSYVTNISNLLLPVNNDKDNANLNINNK